VFEPDITPEDSQKMFKQWERAVTMCKGWLDPSQLTDEY